MKKHIILLCFAILLINNLSLSQEKQLDQNYYISDNSKSILFGIDKDLYVDSFLGTVFSGKKHFTAHSAVRAGLSLSFDYRDAQEKYESQISSETDEYKDELLMYSLTAIIEYLHYIETNSRVYFFIGAGPQIGYQWRESESYDKDSSFYWEEKNKSDSDRWLFGLQTTLGIECFIARNISLLAEYGFTLYYEKISSNYSYNNDTSNLISETKYLRMKSDAKKLGVSFYF